MQKTFQITAAVAVSALLAAPAQAALITPTLATASSDITNNNDPVYAINESGMNFTGDKNDYTNWTMSAGSGNTAQGTDWMADNPSGVSTWLIVDLGETYNLETISIWNFNPGTTSSTYTNRSSKTVDIYTSTSGVGNNSNDNNSAFDSTGWTSLASDFGLTKNPGNATVSAPNGVLTGLTGVQARYVGISVTAAQIGSRLNRAALGEVQFFGTPVPEPSSLALLAAGGLMMIKRRRRD